jgi:hypothetical protein
MNTTGTPPNALSATLESVGGQHDIFQFTDFDAANLLNNPGADIDVTLPSDFPFDLMGDLGLGLDGSALGFESDGMGFAEFGDMASTGPVEDLNMGFGDYTLVNKSNLAVDPRSLAFGSNRHDVDTGMQYVDGYVMTAVENVAGNNQRGPPQHLEISTHGLPHIPPDGMQSTVSEQFSVTSPLETIPQGDHAQGYYGSFAAPQQHYGGMEQYHHHRQQPQQQTHQYYPMHSYTSPPQDYSQHPAQRYTSPTHSAYASPPPPSTLDDGSVTGTPTGDAYASPPGTARGQRGATASWR